MLRETSLEFEVPPGGEPVCDEFTVSSEIADPETREVTWAWTAYPGAEAYVVEWFEVLEDETELLQGGVLLGAGATSFTTTLRSRAVPPTRRLRVQVQLGEFPAWPRRHLGSSTACQSAWTSLWMKPSTPHILHDHLVGVSRSDGLHDVGSGRDRRDHDPALPAAAAARPALVRAGGSALGTISSASERGWRRPSARKSWP